MPPPADGVSPTGMLALHCPDCGYNLTGLTENRCPECGTTFDPEVLRAGTIKPIELGEVIGRLIWPPALFVASPLLGGLSTSAIPLLWITGIVLVFFGMFNAYAIAVGLAAGRALKRGRNYVARLDRSFVFSCGVGLYCCQLALAAGGCGMCILVLTGGRFL